MSNRVYEVVQNGSGWVLRRSDRTPLVEFATHEQALLAALAVSRDEGLSSITVRPANGLVQTISTTELAVFAA